MGRAWPSPAGTGWVGTGWAGTGWAGLGGDWSSRDGSGEDNLAGTALVWDGLVGDGSLGNGLVTKKLQRTLLLTVFFFFKFLTVDVMLLQMELFKAGKILVVSSMIRGTMSKKNITDSY
jgi:hypothetical protein